MHTLVTEQRKEIAQMKAIGATRAQVVKSYLTTSLIIGLIGSIVGAILGIMFAFLIERSMLMDYYGIQAALTAHWQTVFFSILLGISITILATLPAMYQSLKITVRQGLEGVGLTQNGSSNLHKTLLSMNTMPRTAQMGIRNMTRKGGRSASTIIQISLAVGIFLSIVSIGYTIDETISEEFNNFTYDIMTVGQTNDGKPLTEGLEGVIEEIDGVSDAEPFIMTRGQYGDRKVMCTGYAYDTFAYDYEDTYYKGRWFDKTEQESNASVIVVGKSFARVENIKVGDTINMDLATGKTEFEVIGINSGQMNNGMIVFIPINSLQNILLWNDTVSGFSVVTHSDNHDEIDHISTALEDELLSSGYVVKNEIMYLMEEQNQQEIDQIMNMMLAVGSLVILITMIGLMSTLTMNVLERTKEVGMMRCLGSKSGHIRNMFGSEGLVLVLIGWLVGIPLGYAIGSYLNYMVYDLINIEMTYLFPFDYVIIALLVTAAVSIVVIQPPLWRATHFKPGDALRYQ
jgi:putative ABC transport system permease protein